MIIRKTTEQDDFDYIGAIYAESWKTAYRGIVPDEYLNTLEGSLWGGVLRTVLENTFVVLEGDKYVGTSSVCAARDSDMAGWGEIMSIYLLPQYYNRGYGAPLLEVATAALAECGFARIYLWVLAENARAKRFYEKHGFVSAHKTKTMEICGKTLTEEQYIKTL